MPPLSDKTGVVVSGTAAWDVRGSPSASDPGTGIRPTRPLTPSTWIGAQRVAYKLYRWYAAPGSVGLLGTAALQ